METPPSHRGDDHIHTLLDGNRNTATHRRTDRVTKTDPRTGSSSTHACTQPRTQEKRACAHTRACVLTHTHAGAHTNTQTDTDTHPHSRTRAHARTHPQARTYIHTHPEREKRRKRERGRERARACASGDTFCPPHALAHRWGGYGSEARPAPVSRAAAAHTTPPPGRGQRQHSTASNAIKMVRNTFGSNLRKKILFGFHKLSVPECYLFYFLNVTSSKL